MSDVDPGPSGQPSRVSRPAGRPRRPRMVPFLISGAFVGGVIGLVVSFLGPSSGVASAGQESVVLAITGAVVGGAVGAVAFLVAEWTTLR